MQHGRGVICQRLTYVLSTRRYTRIEFRRRVGKKREGVARPPSGRISEGCTDNHRKGANHGRARFTAGRSCDIERHRQLARFEAARRGLASGFASEPHEGGPRRTRRDHDTRRDHRSLGDDCDVVGATHSPRPAPRIASRYPFHCASLATRPAFHSATLTSSAARRRLDSSSSPPYRKTSAAKASAIRSPAAAPNRASARSRRHLSRDFRSGPCGWRVGQRTGITRWSLRVAGRPRKCRAEEWRDECQFATPSRSPVRA